LTDIFSGGTVLKNREQKSNCFL